MLASGLQLKLLPMTGKVTAFYNLRTSETVVRGSLNTNKSVSTCVSKNFAITPALYPGVNICT